jgi:hypothetical protein
MIMMMKKLEWLAGETERLGETLLQYRFVQLTCCPNANPDRRGGKPATSSLSYVTAFHYTIAH